jgi:hypothetical protein
MYIQLLWLPMTINQSIEEIDWNQMCRCCITWQKKQIFALYWYIFMMGKGEGTLQKNSQAVASLPQWKQRHWIWLHKIRERYFGILFLRILRKLTSNVYVNIIRYQFWCTRCAFRQIMSLQWYSGQNIC